jgi:hypothetical protein
MYLKSQISENLPTQDLDTRFQVGLILALQL